MDQKRQYRKWLGVIARARKDEARGFDEMWEAVLRVVDGGLWKVAHRSESAFVVAVTGTKVRTARRMMRVARLASPAEEARYGVAKLDAVIAFLEAKAGKPAAGRLPVAFDRVRVPVVREGKRALVGIGEASVREIRAAAAELAPAKNVKRSKVERALLAAIGRRAVRAGAWVRVREGTLELGRVPLDALERLARAAKG